MKAEQCARALRQGERVADAPNALVRAYEDWDGTSAQLVEAATIAFGFLLLPQACRPFSYC
jgi:hypothetical protein